MLIFFSLWLRIYQQVNICYIQIINTIIYIIQTEFKPKNVKKRLQLDKNRKILYKKQNLYLTNLYKKKYLFIYYNECNA